MAKTSLSIIVPVYNATPYLAAMFRELFLDGLKKNASLPGMELVIVDDASPLREETAAAVTEVSGWTRVKYLRNERNIGYLRSCNRGLAAAEGDLLVLCNSDTRFPPGALQRLIAAAEANPDVGMVGPVTNGAFGASAQLSGLQPELKDFSRAELDRLDALGGAAQAATRLEDVRWLLGFCVLLKRGVLSSAGFLDEKFGFGYQEEVDYGIRARRAGWRLCLEPGAFVFHGGLRRPLQLFGSRAGSQSSGQRPVRTVLRIAANIAYLWRKYGFVEITAPQKL